MRTYLILKEKVARFNADAEIQGLLKDLDQRGAATGQRLKFSTDTARELKHRSFDLEAMRRQGYAYEKLDQLTMEVLLGVR
jgi:xylose isomerase